MTEPPRGDIPAAQSIAPHCYRHPERETWIRCTRCERPICPDCMVAASVGFQCPTCVAEGNRGVRRPRTTFGGRVSEDPGYVSKSLIAVCVVMYVLQRSLPGRFTTELWLIGGRPEVGIPGVASGELWRLLTAAFLHGGVLHLLLNMYAVYLFGPQLESAFGRARFLVLYLVSALGGSAASYTFSSPLTPSLGASGAVFGLLGASLVVSRKLGRDASFLYVLLAVNLAFGFVAANIDWKAHLGGLAAGALTASALVYAPRARRTLVQAVGAAAVVLVILAAVVARSAALSG
jgi:membrane associated rhomboid family serine protease